MEFDHAISGGIQFEPSPKCIRRLGVILVRKGRTHVSEFGDDQRKKEPIDVYTLLFGRCSKILKDYIFNMSRDFSALIDPSMVVTQHDELDSTQSI
jgi:hypothetical protein